MNIKGKVIVITGGTDGLGKEIASVLSPNNSVIILSPTVEKLKNASKEINSDYENCDISKWGDIKRSVASIINKYKRIDCVISCAAIWIQDELDTNDPIRIKRTIEVNLTGQILLTKAFIPQMKKQKEGLFIFINSQAGLYHKAERSVYNASKWGLTGFTKSLQAELAKYGIGVTGIYPGKMNTKMFEKMGIQKDMSDSLDPVYVAKIIEFVLEQPNNVVFPEIGIKNIVT